MDYHIEKNFSNQDYSKIPLTKGEYEHCVFENCNFITSDLSGQRFIDTEFIECNVSNAKINMTSLQGVSFHNCKMLGLPFDGCNEFNFSAKFEKCVLNYSVFYKLSLTKVSFNDCQLEEVDFSEAEMKGTSLLKCNLLNAVFDQTNLEGADFREAVNFSIDPEKNRIKGAKFSRYSIEGLLNKYQLEIE